MSTQSKNLLTIAILVAVVILSRPGGLSIVPLLTPAPIPEAGNHVLIVAETETQHALPAGQLDIITSNTWRQAWLARGGQIRVLDPSHPHPNDAPKWQAAMQRKRDSLPWAIVSNGKTGFEGPLPASLAAWDALLDAYGAAP